MSPKTPVPELSSDPVVVGQHFYAAVSTGRGLEGARDILSIHSPFANGECRCLDESWQVLRFDCPGPNTGRRRDRIHACDNQRVIDYWKPFEPDGGDRAVTLAARLAARARQPRSPRALPGPHR